MKQLILMTLIVLGAVACKKDSNDDNPGGGTGNNPNDTSLQVIVKADGVQINDYATIPYDTKLKFHYKVYGSSTNGISKMYIKNMAGTLPFYTKQLTGTYYQDSSNNHQSAAIGNITFMEVLIRDQDSVVKYFHVNIQ